MAILSVPAMMYSFSPNPPLGNTGAPGQGTCASCHGTLTTPSALTMTAPASYTAGSTTAVAVSVNIPSSRGFELAILDSTGATAGTLTAGTGSQVTNQGGINYVSNSASGTSWSFMWTPPATSVGNLTVYATGGTLSVNYSSTTTITASGTTSGPPTLTVTPSPLSFTATVGGTAPSQNVSVAASDGSAVSFSVSAATTSGGSWLQALPATGTTPGTEAVSVFLQPGGVGLAAGTYKGTVTFTSSAVSNSPVTLPVTLTVTSTTPPPPTGAMFSFVVVDKQSGGSDWLLLYGSGSVSSSNTVTGSGSFTRFRGGSGGGDDSGSGANATIVANGTWNATSVTSSTPGSGTGGTLVLEVQLTTTTTGSSTLSTAALTISNTSTSSGATLAITGGDTFNPVGIGTASITSEGTSGGGGGEGGDHHPGTGKGHHDH